MARIGEAGEVYARRCFNHDCKHCMKSKPQCRIFYGAIIKGECDQRENEAHPPLGYPGSVGRNAYTEFEWHHKFRLSELKKAREQKELRQYRKLKREGKI